MLRTKLLDLAKKAAKEHKGGSKWLFNIVDKNDLYLIVGFSNTLPKKILGIDVEYIKPQRNTPLDSSCLVCFDGNKLNIYPSRRI